MHPNLNAEWLALSHEVKHLRAENERLRAALKDIADNCMDSCECSGAQSARRAIEQDT